MAQGYDSDVQLSVGLSLEDAKSQAQKLTAEVSKVFNSIDSSKLDNKMKKLQATISKVESQIESTYQKIEQLEQRAADTENFRTLQEAVDAGRQEIDRLSQSLQKAQEAGDQFKVDKISTEIQNLTHDVGMFEQAMTDMIDSGFKPFTDEDNARLAEYKNQLGDLNNQQRLNIEAFNEMANASSNNNSAIKASSVSFKDLANAIRTGIQHAGRFTDTLLRLAGLGRVVDGLRNRFNALISRFRSGTQASEGFGKSLQQGVKKLFAYGLGIASLTSLFGKIRSAITSGINAMAKMNGGVNQTNAMMTQLTSSLNLLKGALATAFLPILTTVSPILSSLMQQLANVITFIGMMIAKLTGAKSFTKAVFKSTDYASGLGGSGGGGKSAQEKYDEAVKKAQEKYDKKVAETEAKNAERMAKAEEKQAKAAKKLAKEQDKANGKLAAFDDLNVLGVDTLEELEDIEADLLDMPELELPNLEDFTGSGGGGAGDPFGLEEVPIEDWQWNWDELLAKAQELGEKLAEFLNDIFKDEDLARKIGNTIGNLINMAIRFAYGFVNKFDFLQFGRWLGALIQEALETIEWDTLGTTIGRLVNGIADTIIGFFQTYQVGTLGASISEMLNNAIREVNPAKIGEATLDVLQAPLLELQQVLTDTHWKELGAKVGEWLKKVFTVEGLKGQTIGQTVGKTIADIINMGVQFLLGLKLTTVVAALTTFFEDMIGTALVKIDWMSLLELLFGRGGLLDAILSFTERLMQEIRLILMAGFEVLLHSLPEPLKTVIEQLFSLEGIDLNLDEVTEQVDASFKEQLTYVENLRDGTITAYDEMSGKAGDFLYQLERVGEGYTFNKEQLDSMVESGRFTEEQIDKLIGGMQNFATESGKSLDMAALGLQGYDGNWRTFVALQELRASQLKGYNNEIQLSDNQTKDVANNLHDEMLALKGNVGQYTEETNANLTSMQQNAGITVTSFEDMATQLNTSLETLTEYIQTWYDNMVLTYFSYETWIDMFQSGPILALTDFFVGEPGLFSVWDEQMQLWWDEHVLKWFTADWWNEQVFAPWEAFRDKKWNELMVWWTKNMTLWWNQRVIVWFKEDDWKKQFDHIKEAARKTGEETQKLVTQFADDTTDAIIKACDKAIEKIEEVIEKLNEALELAEKLPGGGGGGGSSSGNSGTRGGSNGAGGSGGRTRPFMPMLDIMHFEDNLGMSAFKFPELATGAVIPPNNKFLAVLGDQKSGMNIETPLATMVEAFRSVMDEYMNPSTRNATMEVDGETFARLMMPHMMDEMNRLGYNTEIIEGM